MDSNKELKNENYSNKNVADSVSVTQDDSVKKDIHSDLKKYITKIDNRVKTKVIKYIII
jgi:hypothetical protein